VGQTLSEYVLLAPDGRHIVLTAAVFDGLAMFIGGERKHEAGKVEIQFRNGGVAGVEVNAKLK
jgi:hypothetical protein